MGERLIKPYEISVWEDKLTQNGFIEKKLAVIGSDTMTGYNKVYNPVFNKKSNGEKTLTFSLKYKYFDPYTGNSDFVNPFATLLVNERKVKLYYDNQWYEFIIKDHTESSDGLEWTYTCTDAFVLELSKNGYNITFDSELNNNQGTARELADKTLKDTDWKVGGVDNLKQLVAEPVYNAVLESVNGIEIINTDDNLIPHGLTSNTNIYLFYSYVKNQDGKFVQFIVKKDAEQYTIDDKNVITDTNYRITTDLIYKNDGFYLNENTRIISWSTTENKYQVNRLEYGQLTTYDSVMQRTVDRFKVDNGDLEIYRYTNNVYTTSNVITNLITNGDNFNVLEDGTLQGWNPYVDFTHITDEDDENVDKLELVTFPELNMSAPLADLSTLSQVEGFLKVKFKGPLTLNESTHRYENAVFNSGIENNTSTIQSIARGDKFVFRWRAGTGELGNLTTTDKLRLVVARYTQDKPGWGYYYKHFSPSDIILEFTGTPVIYNNFITGGTLQSETIEEQTITNYVIDNVPQTPSTKYIYVDGEQNDRELVWSGTTGEFDDLDNTDWSNYMPYYYLTAEAREAIPNSVLKDPTEKIGIFIYTIDDIENTYYIQDAQLTRYVEDAEGHPVLIGNVPVAKIDVTDYYYVKPTSNEVEDIVIYTSLDEVKEALGLAQNVNIIPLYNEDSEKNLTISASKSNCFNILQTIAETFECWIDLVVEHEDNGVIRCVDGMPQKYVYLREYVGKDNYAGFKYGINLESIERTVNSDEIVTKLIVDQSQSDYVDEGYISIANAPSNQSGESYILNFDYYYNQNLLDRESVEADKLQLITSIAAINKDLQNKEKQRRDLEASLTILDSKRNIYTELITTAEDTLTRASEDFEYLTGFTYESYQQKQASAVIYDNKYYILTADTTVNEDKTYYTYINEVIEEVEEPIGNPQQSGWYESLVELPQEETVLNRLGEIYASSATINNYSGILTNIEQEYWQVREELRGSANYKVKVWVGQDDNRDTHVFVELDDYFPGFSFTLNESSPYQSTVSVKYFDITNNEPTKTISFNVPEGYTITPATCASFSINNNEVITFRINPNQSTLSVEDEIEDIQEQKDKLTNEFNNKYRRFIQEGTWNSTDYIDSELYYLDALQVSNTSAQPTVSYTINVVEISELEGYEWYLFDAGDKTYVEDIEFFGWANKGGVLTPAREEVIISEVEWHLDEPDQNIITVQNYKTRFEDLFQRISAAVQTVQYNEATYAKISTLLDANGTINQDVLLESLNRISGQKHNLTSDGSVIIDGDRILVQNLNNLANCVIINSEGIRISSDGGQTWRTAIDGQGINIGTVYTGTLNTQNVVIGSSDNPSFRWDKSGISAYKSGDDDIYDLQTYVRYDEYGLYGIKNGGSFKAQSLQDVIDKAHFAVTWDGFFIKNSYTDGRVEITSDNDFQVIQTINNEDHSRIKIGALEFDANGNPTKYGININQTVYNETTGQYEDVPAFTTGTDGNVIITGTINATGGNFTGLVRVGEGNPYIQIDGPNAAIGTSNYQDGASYGWMINAEGDAVFNNITARGAIRTAVFEYAEIQAVGGIFIFRPSSTIRDAARVGSTDDVRLTLEKPYLFKVGDWCKVSNYTDGNGEPIATAILSGNGLTHVYKVKSIDENNSKILILENAYSALTSGNTKVINDITDLIGGALIDMGDNANGNGQVGNSNYGIGVNSSDNVVNLPARAISLFETIVDETRSPKVSYRYRGILGTLPALQYTGVNPQVSQLYHDNLEGTQGIYTDNMYLGDDNQYLTFYTDKVTGEKKLKIRASQVVYEVYDSETHQPTGEWSDINDTAGQPGPPGEDAITVRIESNVGNEFVMTNETARLMCTVYQGTTDITNSVTRFTWTKTLKDGTPDTTWNQAHENYNDRYIDIGTNEVNIKAIFNCHVLIPES